MSAPDRAGGGMRLCEHGMPISVQSGTTLMDIEACQGNEFEESGLLMFYSACDCCDALMHHDTCGYGYQVLPDGRTLCNACNGTDPRGQEER